MKPLARALQNQTAPVQSNVAPPAALLLGKPIESAINAPVYAHPRTGLITTYTAVCDIGYLSRVLAAGWRCDPLGMPQVVNGSMIGAFCIHIEADTFERMLPGWRTDMPALALSEPAFRAAA